MIEDTFENRKIWDFKMLKVDARDRVVTLDKMFQSEWIYNGEESGYSINANPAILLFFVRRKDIK